MIDLDNLVDLRDLVFMQGFDEFAAQARIGPIVRSNGWLHECQTLHPQFKEPAIEMTRGFVSGIRVDFTEPVVATRYQVLRSFGTPRTLLMALDDWGGPVPEQFKHRNEHFTGTVILDIAQGSSDDELRIVGIIIRRHRPKPKAP